MDFYIVIPCHNEASFIKKTLESLVTQTLPAKKIVVVNDQSTDASGEIITAFAKAYTYIELLDITSSDEHLPGSKVIQAFHKGYVTLDDNYDIVCKFDADLIFPSNYLETIAESFEKNPKIGMAGGFCYIEKNGEWVLENLTNKDHIRGALKAYRKECFQEIDGLKAAMGWDTIDELLAKYHGWEIITVDSLQVKHLKPTGNTYNKAAQFKQGEAFYRMRYGFLLTSFASAKLANRKGNYSLLKDYLHGYFRAKRSNTKFLVSEKEGEFIRKLRWDGIKSKLSL
ncbi:glycosyltransferase [Dokdonia sp. Hel_I_53]|uniref:glycosyltransferase n=1 Tax=Dokdonia sp. Hel_I_53 TaxID=1566287 RepID=UPI00119B8FDA|nr:glycosyltransferase family 2 protein [Dokdonia sp. Hel_I_53]TVZ53149.1 glycosyl transferase family 2 [Dokdonia sp. Hel_I_53]